MNREKAARAFGIAARILAWVLIAFTVGMMVFTVVTVTTVDQNDRGLFGFKLYIVRSDSMSLSENNRELVHFEAGDIIIAKDLDEGERTALLPGDVISFVSTNRESYLETVTHMIRTVRKDPEGRVLGYVTFGTNTGTNDEALVTPAYILGQYVGKLPGLGHFFAFVKSTPGYLVCILLPFLLLILYHGANILRLIRRQRRETAAVIEAERAEVQREREENRKMLEELLSLKERLAAKDGTEAEDNGNEKPEA